MTANNTTSISQNQQPMLTELARDDLAQRRVALERELSHHAIDDLCRTAERYARVGRGSELARDIVGDALRDVLTGELACAVGRPLFLQLQQEVMARGKREYRREYRRQRTHVSLETIVEDAAVDPALVIEPFAFDDHHLGAPDPADVVARIRELARDDPDAQQLLAVDRRDRIPRRRNLLAAGMTAWRYRAARERLTAYARQARDTCGAETSPAPADTQPES